MVLVPVRPRTYVWICWPQFPRRFAICILCFLMLSISLVMRVCVSHLVTEVLTSKSVTAQTLSTNQAAGKTVWDTETKDIILSAFLWSYPLSQLTGGLLAERVSARLTLTFSLLVSSVCTLITPVVVWMLGAKGLVALQVLSGLAQGVLYSSMNVVLSKWVPSEERARLSSFVYSGEIVGTLFSLSVASVLPERMHPQWQSAFYLIGAGGVCLALLWNFFGCNRPEDYPGISNDEKNYLQRGPATRRDSQHLPHTPWKRMLTSVPLWALIIAKAGTDWAHYTVINRLPRYTQDIRHCPFDGENPMLWTVAPYAAVLLIAIGGGILADWIINRETLDTTLCRKVFVIVGSACSALALQGSYYTCHEVGTGSAVALYVVAVGLSGLFYPGLLANTLDLNYHYPGTVMALVNGISSLLKAVRPYLIGYYITNGELHRWRDVFSFTTAVYVVSALIFSTLGSAEEQHWTSNSNGDDATQMANYTDVEMPSGHSKTKDDKL